MNLFRADSKMESEKLILRLPTEKFCAKYVNADKSILQIWSSHILVHTFSHLVIYFAISRTLFIHPSNLYAWELYTIMDAGSFGQTFSQIPQPTQCSGCTTG